MRYGGDAHGARNHPLQEGDLPLWKSWEGNEEVILPPAGKVGRMALVSGAEGTQDRTKGGKR